MRQELRAAALVASLAASALAACNSSGEADLVAKAPDEPAPRAAGRPSAREALDARIAYYAKANDIPESLVHAAVRRESGYNPTLKHGPYWGLMQIRYDTARGVGYKGPANGLLDPETNLAYGSAYLANAFRVADGNERRALRLYASGFYYEAKRRGLLEKLRSADASLDRDASAIPAEAGK